MDTLRHFFELPTFADEESNTRARVMYTVLIAVIILAALIAVIGLITGGAQRQNMIMGMVLLFVFVGLLKLLCWGYLRSVVWIFSLMFIAAATFGTYNLGTIYSHMLVMYLIAITTAGLMLNTRIAAGFLVLTIVAMGGLGWAEGMGMLPPPSKPPTGPYIVMAGVGSFIVVVQHLTQRGLTNALGRVREVSAQQNAVLDSAAVGITLLVDRKFVWVNQGIEEIFGYPNAEFEGQSTEMLFPSPQDYAELGEEAYPLLAQGQHYYAERLMKRKDGSQFECSLTGRAVNANDLSQGVIWTLEDITGRREAEKERERLQQEVIEAQQQTLKELSTPIIPIMDGIVVMPLIGSIDTIRARDITRALLAGISSHQAKVVILDITGVSIVDTGVANHLHKTIQAAQLKGARTIVTGISDAVAETIVELGIDWRGVTTLNDLQTGLVTALDNMGINLSQ